MHGLFNIKVTSKYFNGILKLIFPKTVTRQSVWPSRLILEMPDPDLW